MSPFDPISPSLTPWHDFFMLTGAAAATLTGLMFVAVTFGSGLVRKETAEGARAFLDPIYGHFAQVLITAAIAVAPSLPAWLFGGVLALVAARRLVGLRSVYRTYVAAHAKHGDIEASDWATAIVLPAACHLALAAVGAGFCAHHELAPIGLAVVIVAVLLIGIQAAWELLLWMTVAMAELAVRPSGAESPRAPPKDAIDAA